MKALIAFSFSCLFSIAWADSNLDRRPTAHQERAEPPTACGDYLKEIGRGRPEIRFLGCKSITRNDSDDRGFEATYRVKGADIDKIDNWLATWTDWKHLRFSCCQWDSPTGFYKSTGGAEYYIEMSAEAYVKGHMVNQRKDFVEIPYATLTITHYLYLP
jgi:hypothetical protein